MITDIVICNPFWFFNNLNNIKVKCFSKFKTFIDKSAAEREVIIFSAGKIGYQVELTLPELSKVIEYSLEDLTV